MRIKVFSFILTLLILAFCGCYGPRTERALTVAESVMEERPDSALAILEAIDGRTLRGERRARHALLLSQAYDKNYIDISSDSLISIAVDYYAASNEDYYKMLAFLYRAVVNLNAGNFEAGLKDGLNAYDIALERNDAVRLYRIEAILGAIYDSAFSFQSAYEWDLQALKHAKIADRKLAGFYANVGSDLYNLQRFGEAIEYLDSASRSVASADSFVLELQHIANCQLGNISTADSIFAEIINAGFQPSARVISNQAELHPQTMLETLNKFALEHEISSETLDADLAYTMAYIRQGDMAAALAALQRHIKHFNDIVSSTKADTLSKIRHQHDTEIAREQARKTRSYRNILLMSVLLLCLVTIIALLIIAQLRTRQKTKRLEMGQNLFVLENEYKTIKNQLEQSKTQISEKQNRINSLEEELFGLYAQNDAQTIINQEETISSLHQQVCNLRKVSYQAFLKQFSWVERLGALYLQSANTPNNREKAINELVSKEIASVFSKNDFIDSLPGMVAGYDAELMAEIDRLPFIASEREVLLCFICGFSPAVISILLKKTTRAVYNLKARCKTKLREENSPAAMRALEMICD